MTNNLIHPRAQRLFGKCKDLHDLVVQADAILQANGDQLDLPVLLDYCLAVLGMERQAIESPMICDAERQIRGIWIDHQIRIHDELRHGVAAHG